MFDRLIALIGMDRFERLASAKVLIIGLGGVGGYAFEALVRSGVKNITIVDGDVVEESNLNRQIISNNNNIGISKCEAAAKRALEINKDINISIIYKFVTADNFKDLLVNKYDYVIDACDTIDTKKELIKYCLNNKIKIISSMGMGNRLDNTKIKLTTLDKTTYDPLAKKLRQILRKENISLKIPVVCSFEEPIKNNKIGSLAYVTGTAGLLITNYIVNDLLGELCQN